MTTKLEERPDLADGGPIRTGSILESPEAAQLGRNKDDYEHYAAKNASLIILIKASGKRVVGDEVLTTPPLAVRFSNHHFWIHKRHPQIEKVRAGIRTSDSWRNKAVFCVDDLDAKTARRLDPQNYGASTKQRLAALGVTSLSQLAQIMEIGEEVDKTKGLGGQGKTPSPAPALKQPASPSDVPPESRPLGRDELPAPEAVDEDGKD